jgi:tRNA U54 and U55 pseudouridine synthase Pus10
MSDETCCGACGYPIHATKESACDWCRQSADRIEALTEKLAKAVEALEVIRDRQYYRMGPGITAQVIARATLAEIEGSDAP